MPRKVCLPRPGGPRISRRVETHHVERVVADCEHQDDLESQEGLKPTSVFSRLTNSRSSRISRRVETLRQRDGSSRWLHACLESQEGLKRRCRRKTSRRTGASPRISRRVETRPTSPRLCATRFSAPLESQEGLKPSVLCRQYHRSNTELSRISRRVETAISAISASNSTQSMTRISRRVETLLSWVLHWSTTARARISRRVETR